MIFTKEIAWSMAESIQIVGRNIWPQRLYRLLSRLSWTIAKQYDQEEELETLEKEIYDYVSWKDEYIDKEAEEEDEWECDNQRKLQELDKLKKYIRDIIVIVNK